MSFFLRLSAFVIFLLMVARSCHSSCNSAYPSNYNREKGLLFNYFPAQKLTLPKGAIKKTKYVKDNMDCVFACMSVYWCRSVNFKIDPRSNGLHACQLISSDQFAGKQYMGPDKAYSHYSVKNPCQETPCRNDGKCVFQENRQHFHCECKEGFDGEHCEKVDGKWSAWKPWEACSVTCDGGNQSRSRTCTEPAPAHDGKKCSGNSSETRSCGITACPDACAIGMQSKAIKDSQITASSTYGKYSHLPSLARLNLNLDYGCWVPKSFAMGEWIQVDLGEKTAITAIATQGCPNGLEWTKTYSLQSSDSGTSFGDYAGGKNLPGNSDGTTVVKNTLDPLIVARYIRLLPKGYQHSIAIRMELYRC